MVKKAMIVMKFGGTSVEDAAAIDGVAQIVAGRRKDSPVVVVSAMGKTTDQLLRVAATAVEGNRKLAIDLLRDLRDFHGSEARKLVEPAHRMEMETQLDDHFQELSELVKGLAVLGELTPRSIDAIASYGERLSSLIVAQAFARRELPAVHLDSRKCLVTDSRHTRALPLFDKTEKRLKQEVLPLLKKGLIPVMGGFIGADERGVTTTLGRGGSDFSASIIGAALDATRIEIWSDVDGMLTADPRLFSGAHRVKVISFDEASELAYFGAKVLHPSTVLPAVQKKIPVSILNSRKPEVGGTVIISRAPKTKNIFKSIACKTNITIVEIRSTRMLMAHGFLRAIFEVFDRYQTSVDMVSTSEVSVSLTVDSTRHLAEIVEELSRIAQVSHEGGMAIVCLVGDNVRLTPGIAGKVFKAVDRTNIRMISQGASLLNISFVIDEASLKGAVSRLHRAFFKELDPKVFE
jgi:aspartate kinase